MMKTSQPRSTEEHRRSAAANRTAPQSPGAMISDNRAAAVTQQQVMQSIQQGRQATTQAGVISHMNSSPRVVAQQKQLETTFGMTRQRQGGPESVAPLQETIRPTANTQSIQIPANAILQAKRYTVSRELPLKTEVTPMEAKKGVDKLISKLRDDYPIPMHVKVEDDWSADKRDSYRGAEFLQQKAQILKTATGQKTINVPGAHVARIKPGGRERAARSQAAGISKIEKTKEWIGAHLVKREWGGEDNMWNVVAWPDTAEKKWGENFEDPIDTAFTNQTTSNLDISIAVEKEDEVVSAKDAKRVINEKVKDLPEDEKGANWKKFIEEEGAKSRWVVNRAVESVPLKASGSSSLGDVKLEPKDTEWTTAMGAAKASFKATVDKAAKKPPHPKRVPHLKGGVEVEKEKRIERSEERRLAWEQETKNYTPGYEHFSNVT